MTETLNDSDLRRYALLGAEARLVQIDKEAASIYQAFPELRKQAGAQRTQRTSDAAAPAARGRRRGSMSPAQREAVRDRMKRYWAQRRGESAAAATSGSDAAATGATATAAASRKAKAPRTAKATGGARGPRKMSAAARKRISDAQKARWAKRRRANA